MTTTTILRQKSSHFLLVLAALGGMVGAGAAQAATYYVSAETGNDHNSGRNMSAPLKTIGAITNSSHLGSGDTIVVMPGTYYETVMLTKAGKASAYTTLTAQPGAARPVIIGAPDQPGSADDYAAINIWAPYVRVTGFDVTWNGADGDAIGVWGPTAPDNKGVIRPSVHHIDIENNIAHDAGCGGIDSINADYVTVIGNTTYNNGNTAPNQCSGISLGQLTDFDNGRGFRNIISGNLSYNNFNQVPVPGQTYTTDGEGIIIDDSRHTETDNAAYHGATLIYGNIVVGNGGCGILAFSSDNVTVANNTTFQNEQSTTIDGVTAEFSSEQSGTITFLNNIADSGSADAPTFEDNGSTKDSWDYNLSAGGGFDLENDAAPSIGRHNLEGANPQFVLPSTDLAIANFHLGPNSPALRAGEAEGYDQADYGGTVLGAGSKPDLGAYTR